MNRRTVCIAAIVLTACSTGGATTNVASHSRTASSLPTSQSSTAATPTGAPVSQPYGVLVGGTGASYTVTLVDVAGNIVATAQASAPPVASCGGAAGAPVPLPVSTSDSRVYFMDAQGVVRYLAPNGAAAQATTVPAPTVSRHATFAVSPDDRRIAVVVADYGSTGASTRLYVEDLSGGGNHLDLFSESGPQTLWAVGWHGANNLVLAVAPSCTQGGGPFCCGMQELHVVDPATANRRFTIGGRCRLAGPPTAAGIVCEDTANLTASVLDWTAKSVRTVRIGEVEPGLVSPDGDHIAFVSPTRGTTGVYDVATRFFSETAGLSACGWIDDFHLLAGGTAQQQPRITDFRSWTTVPVAALGDCGGRIPGGL
jgi:hypothetical protein